MKIEETSYRAVQELTLEKIRIGLQVPVSPVFLQDMQIKEGHNYLTDHIIYSIRGHIYGKKMQEVVTETKTFPKTWWDMLKQTFNTRFPRLSGRIFKRIHCELVPMKVNHYHVCPHLDISTPNQHLHFMMSGDDDYR